MSRAVIVHGHFYQPPRENPWTLEVDREESAEPFHDWNERVFQECYRANAWARVLDDSGYIESIINNYEHISFNFGPTLLTWIERHHPRSYQRIIAADQESQRHRGGHGNAIAQAYNHTILPLCNDRDRETQILWGMADFEHRFGRVPEAMWLPETACNDETLNALIEAGLKFTILSPYQARRIRPIGGNDWTDASHGHIDTGRPYRFFHRDGSGRSIDIFFYDGPRSRAIAFENALISSQRFIDILMPHNDNGRVVSIATDGESYGHHTHFGDRSLAHAMVVEAKARGIKLTNYGEFLAENAPTHEVEISLGDDGLGTSWSCEHGIGRWFRDCGCQTGAREGWNQAWRSPLRTALDFLRNKAAECFEEETRLFPDPWAARNAYIRVILDPERQRRSFLLENTRPGLGTEDQVRALSLLDMQHNAQLMYTSCGWFFSDISGIETIQILKYAGRVIDSMQELGYASVEDTFLETLANAKSNRREAGNGADLYRRWVDSARVTPSRVAAHLAMTTLVDDHAESGTIAGFRFVRRSLKKRQHGKLSLCTERVSMTNRITGRVREKSVSAMHFGGIDFFCVVSDFTGIESFKTAASKLWSLFPTGSLPSLLRLASEEFGPEEYGLEHVLPDGRERISEIIFGTLLQRFLSRYAMLYEDNQRTLDMLQSTGFPVPRELRAAAEFTLGRKFEDEIRHQQQSHNAASYKRAIEIAEEVAERGFQIDRSFASKAFGSLITNRVYIALEQPTTENIDAANALLEVSGRLSLTPNLDIAQEAVHDAVKRLTIPPREEFRRLVALLRISPKALSD